MKTSEKGGRKRFSASFVMGVVSLVFLVIGYQSALLLHKSAVLTILSNRDRPDTVFVASEGQDAFPDGASPDMPEGAYSAAVDIGSGNASPAATGMRTVGRRESPHEPAVMAVRSASRATAVESFAFDPNTVSIHDLIRLGFTEKQAVSIDNYRKKGGRFRRKTDFARSFVVADSVYRRLEPYIEIPLVDLNLADSAAFDALPGIGGYFASKMVEHRRRLGGSYSHPEQLMDIWRFDREKYDALADLVEVNPRHVRPYGLWTLPEDSLRLHPYIGNFAVAHGIVLFRENNPVGEWSVAALEKAGVLSMEAASKLSRCVIAAPSDGLSAVP